MLSAMQSREFGWGFRPLSGDEVQLVNNFRRDKDYVDTDAAKMIYGDSKKKELKPGDNPFVQYFNYGAAKDGYWSYEHLVCQIENCQDVLSALYKDFDVRYNVDHSCGHDR